MKKLIGAVLLLIAGLTSKAQFPCLPASVSMGIMAFYPFDATSTNDYSGFGHHMINSGATPTFDRFGTPNCAYHFDEDVACPLNDYMHTSAAFLDPLFITPGVTFSVSLWYHPMTPLVPYGFSDYELLLGRGVPGICAPVHCPDTWQEWSIGLYDCRQVVSGIDKYSTWQNTVGGSGLSCNGYYAATSGPGAPWGGPYGNGWHHVVYVYNGGSGAETLYVDNAFYTTSSTGCFPPAVTPGLSGELVLGDMFTGDLDDIIIYNWNLSSVDVNTLYLARGCCNMPPPQQKGSQNIPEDTKSSARPKIYPNPAGSTVSVSAAANGGAIKSVSIYTATGQLLHTYNYNAREVSIDIDKLAAGMYMLKVTTENGTTTEKLLKK